MAQTLDLFFQFGHLLPYGHANLGTDDSVAQHKPGVITIGVGAFGLSMYRYGKTQQSGGQSKGELAARVANVTGSVTAASGETNDTTHLADTSNFTAGNEEGKICIITDDNGGAGAAPEGEVAVITDNTASQLTFDPDYALSVAPAASDTYLDYSLWIHDDAADGDLAINILGILMQDRTAAYYGWLQFYGINPGAIFISTVGAVTAGDPVVAAATGFGAYGSDTEQLWIGHSMYAIASDIASPKRTAVFVDLLHMSQPIA